MSNLKIDIDNLESITPDFVKQLDAYKFPPVWLQDDYLSMRSMAFCGNKPLYFYLDKLQEVKDNLREEGYVFNCDILRDYSLETSDND